MKKILVLIVVLVVAIVAGFYISNNLNMEELFYERDIELLYTNPLAIITKNLSIKPSRIDIKDDGTELFLYITIDNGRSDEESAPISYKVYDSKNNLLCETKSETSIEYLEEYQYGLSAYDILKLKDYKNDDLKLEVYDKNTNLLSTVNIETNLEKIKVKKDDKFEKISEIELKGFLGTIANLGNDLEFPTAEDIQIDIAIGYFFNSDAKSIVEISRKVEGYNEELKMSGYPVEKVNDIIEKVLRKKN